jgi:hypothetical protein
LRTDQVGDDNKVTIKWSPNMSAGSVTRVDDH